jgi:flagellin
MNKSLQRLSSGYRINSAADDAAGLAISQQFGADIASYKVGSQNVSQANALLQIAGGAMDQIANMLTRLKELATQAASANAGSNLGKINAEGNALIDEINRIANSTKYAGTALINGTFSAGNTSVTWNAISNIYNLNVSNAAAGAYTAAYSATTNDLTITKGGVSETVNLANGAHAVNFATQGISFSTTAAFDADTAGAAIAAAGITVVAGGAANFQVGTSNSADDRIAITLADVTATTLGVTQNQLNSATLAQAFLGTVDTAIGNLSTAQGTVGAAQNRLGYANANLATTIQNFTAANSTIKDVDMASEMTNFTKNQILVQAGTAMLAQANMAPQQVLSLFK